MSLMRCFGTIKASSQFIRHFSSVTDQPPFYDIVVAGGGMVGASMVASLGHDPAFRNKKILLLEAAPNAGRSLKDVCKSSTLSSRVCALSPASVRLLQGFGAWDEIVNSKRYRAVKRMHVWESCSDAAITFDNDAIATDLAYIVENDVILAAVCKQLDAVKDIVQVKYSSKIKDFIRPRNAEDGGSSVSDGGSPWMKLILGDDRTIETRLLVGADGFQSLVRRRAGIHDVKWDYDQRAVVAVVRLDNDSLDERSESGDDLSGVNDTAWQRFLPNGPIALLPLTSNSSCLIWTTSPADAKRLLALSPVEFTDALNAALWSDEHRDPLASYIGNIVDGAIQAGASSGLSFLSPSKRQLSPNIASVEPDSRATFPLGLCHATRYVDRRMALIGDSAHRVHPLAGQGVNLGFGDVQCLHDLLADAVYKGRDLGSSQHLLSYETARQRRVVPIMAAVDAMNRIYSNTFTPLVLLRSAVCRTANAVGAINSAMIKVATS